ncbi:MAG: DUF1015 domain-containing protein [Elusimicrobia bacterium]|nr:DUF1015 domain-containing protein [Elusimicrobiota bacterium]
MAEISPFRGLRFDPARTGLSRALCPPYDVIPAEEAARLRGELCNAIHLELPEGEGPEKYARAAVLWTKWKESGLLIQDPEPAFYASEERFSLNGRAHRRMGFLAALGVTPQAARFVIPHERTLSKPKTDRLNLLRSVRANISPIFGIFPDSSGSARRVLKRALEGKPIAQGVLAGVEYRLWRVDDPALVKSLQGVLASKNILIADGHHRYEVSRAYYEETRSAAASTVLAYLCPEEDAGLIMLPTHRVVSEPLAEGSLKLCRLIPCPSREVLLKKLARSPSPYAFGIADRGFNLAKPKSAGGCKSGLCVEWLGRNILGAITPDQIQYTPDPEKAEALAHGGKTAIFVKPAPISQVRKAVKAVGLLPPKSTYFFPKIATGLVFKSL